MKLLRLISYCWNAVFPNGIHFPWANGLIFCLCVGTFYLPPETIEAMVYDRAKVADGEFYRHFTWHFVHADSGFLWFGMIPLYVYGAFWEGGGSNRDSFHILIFLACYQVLSIVSLELGLMPYQRLMGSSGITYAMGPLAGYFITVRSGFPFILVPIIHFFTRALNGYLNDPENLRNFAYEIHLISAGFGWIWIAVVHWIYLKRKDSDVT